MPKQVTIQGHLFNVEDRYSEGHELSENEAAALNQTLHENFRNNFAKKVEEKLNGRESLEEDEITELQAELDDYAESYEFGIRGGGAVRDPVMSEAMRLMRDKITKHMKAKGVKRKDVDAKEITEQARKLIEKNPHVLELARQRVEQLQANAELANIQV